MLRQIDAARLPRHVAIIMDGNGRWARNRHLPRVAGHRAGISSVRAAVETAARLHLPALTLYAFSTENWKRPESETSFLMRLLRRYLRDELSELQENNIRLQAIGRISELPEAVRDELRSTCQATASNTGTVLSLALNYSGRTELVDTFRLLAERVRRGELAPEAIDEQLIGAGLFTRGLPDPDLLIRTSGELRLSNFLLWQIAYAELWVTNTLWPDFRAKHFYQAILDFQSRDRRFGGLSDEPHAE